MSHSAGGNGGNGTGGGAHIVGLSGANLVRFRTKNVLGDDMGRDLMDVGCGKDGVMSAKEALNVEQRVMAAIVSDDATTSLLSQGGGAAKAAFMIALRVYLAMHSSENADDGSGGLDDGVVLTFGPSQISGAEVKKAAGVQSFHRYLRCRADEVSASITYVLNRAKGPGAATQFPQACATARFLTVNARKRHLADYPQYAFVGAEYCSTVTPRVAAVLEESKRLILAAVDNSTGPTARSGAKSKTGSGSAGAASLSGFPDF